MVHLPNIKLGDLEHKANWQTFSLADWVINLSVECLTDAHNMREYIVSVGVC